MNYRLTDDQKLMRDMVERLTKQYRRDSPSVEMASVPNWDHLLWQQAADLGVLSATLPEQSGGLGGGPIESTLILQAFGRHLVTSPYIPTIICAAALIAREGTDDLRAEHLPLILDGQRIFAFACSEPGSSSALSTVQTVAVRSDFGYHLSGRKTLVVNAPICDRLLVIARRPEGLAAFVTALDRPGIEANYAQTIDGGTAAELTLSGVFIPNADVIGGMGVDEAIERLLDEAIVALCAEACGSISALLDATVHYAKTRQQFGQPIGRFQVLQHRMVDMLMASEQAISITQRAASYLDGESICRKREASAAKAYVGLLGRKVAYAAVQIHGAIGTTEELDVSQHFRRIEMLNLQYGSIEDHIQRYADLLDDVVD